MGFLVGHDFSPVMVSSSGSKKRSLRHAGTIAWECMGYNGPYICRAANIGLSINGGTPKWMVFIRENPLRMDDN